MYKNDIGLQSKSSAYSLLFLTMVKPSAQASFGGFLATVQRKRQKKAHCYRNALSAFILDSIHPTTYR